MGFEENAAYQGQTLFFKEFENKREIVLMRDARSHNKAVWLLADYSIPPDTKEAAMRWGMEQTIMEIWRNAFIAGWRAAHKEVI